MIGHCPGFIQKITEAFISKDQLNDRVLYMIYGSEDSRRVTDFVPEFQKDLKAKAPVGFDSKLEIIEGEGHVLIINLERGIQYIFSKK